MFAVRNLVQSSQPLARTFAKKAAKAAAAAADHSPPKQLFGMTAKYANAIYTSASKAGELAKVEKDLKNVQENLKASKGFADFLEDPTVNRANKVRGLDDLLGKAGYSKLTTAFLSVLAENGRAGSTSAVIDTFTELMMANRGEVPAHVVSAEELTDKQVKALQESMKSYIGDGEKLVLTREVDPEILGGLRVQVGDRYIDLSISSKIQKINGVLSAAI